MGRKPRSRKSKSQAKPPRTLQTVPGPIGQRLRVTQKRREQNLRELRRTFELHLLACNQAVAWFDWMQSLCVDHPLNGLLGRVPLDVHRALEAALAGDYPTVNDIGRDLMEIEVLLLDFVREPSQVQKWAQSADDHAKASAFSFRKVTDRLRAAAGLAQDQILPNNDEYMAHSAGLHPTPRGHGPGAWGSQDPVVQLDHDLSDLLMHTARTIEATMQLADATAFFKIPDQDPPPLDAFEGVGYVLTMRAQALEPLLNEVLNQAGLEMGPRAPRNRGDLPFTRSISTGPE